MDEGIEPCFLGTLVHGSLQVPPAGDRGVLELLVAVIAVVLRERHGKEHRKPYTDTYVYVYISMYVYI